jgi:single-strand DNA-binding protein
LRHTKNGKPYLRLVLAVEGYWNRKEKEMTVDWIPVKVWAREAQRCQYLVKGSLIAVTGRVSVAQYPGENGETEYVTEIVGEDVQFLAKPRNAVAEATSGNTTRRAVAR